MYNQYLPNDDWMELEDPPAQSSHAHDPPRSPTSAQSGSNTISRDIAGGISKFLGDITKHFSLEKLDTGDILLVLILLFLFLEGDNLELIITLGLMLLLGLGDDESQV